LRSQAFLTLSSAGAGRLSDSFSAAGGLHHRTHPSREDRYQALGRMAMTQQAQTILDREEFARSARAGAARRDPRSVPAGELTSDALTGRGRGR
jgi:hypothetical protein